MKVFVYGTLKSGHGNNAILRTSKFEKEYIVQGFKLFDAGFPVATQSDGDSIIGEIWDIGEDKQVLHNLDRLESEGRMYHRVEIEPGLWMYVGDNNFWRNFTTLDECRKTNNGNYIYSR